MTNSNDAEATLTWYEEETMRSLKRLAQARAYLAELEEMDAAAQATSTVVAAQVDIDRLAELQAEFDRVWPKTTARFGADKARTRIDEIEMQMRLILDRIGFETYDDFLDAGAVLPTTVEPVDPSVLEFARREVAAAEAAWTELLLVDIPEPEVQIEEDDDDVVPFHRPAASA